MGNALEAAYPGAQGQNVPLRQSDAAERWVQHGGEAAADKEQASPDINQVLQGGG